VNNKATRWPKAVPELTPEQKRISDDFMKHWLEILPQRYALLDAFNHGYAVDNAVNAFRTTLEIGAGNGEHLYYEKLSPEQRASYFAVDIRANVLAELRRRHPDVQCVEGNCQERMNFPDGFFDRIVAIHVLEHLPDLPAAIDELHRLCNRDHGFLSVVIPCEGGLAYSLARKISSERIFRKRYGQPFKWCIEREHLNRPHEILSELQARFKIIHRRFFPLWLPVVSANLVIGITLRPL
jgi:SAM-dependent methyltransferase